MPADHLTKLASAMLLIRKDRGHHFPLGLLASEQAWNLLLVLFVADADGRQESGRDAIREAGGAESTGARWLQYLTQKNLIVGDGQGHLENILTLTPYGLHAMERWLDNAHLALAE